MFKVHQARGVTVEAAPEMAATQATAREDDDLALVRVPGHNANKAGHALTARAVTLHQALRLSRELAANGEGEGEGEAEEATAGSAATAEATVDDSQKQARARERRCYNLLLADLLTEIIARRTKSAINAATRDAVDSAIDMVRTRPMGGIGQADSSHSHQTEGFGSGEQHQMSTLAIVDAWHEHFGNLGEYLRHHCSAANPPKADTGAAPTTTSRHAMARDALERYTRELKFQFALLPHECSDPRFAVASLSFSLLARRTAQLAGMKLTPR